MKGKVSEKVALKEERSLITAIFYQQLIIYCTVFPQSIIQVNFIMFFITPPTLIGKTPLLHFSFTDSPFTNVVKSRLKLEDFYLESTGTVTPAKIP